MHFIFQTFIPNADLFLTLVRSLSLHKGYHYMPGLWTGEEIYRHLLVSWTGQEVLRIENSIPCPDDIIPSQWHIHVFDECCSKVV